MNILITEDDKEIQNLLSDAIKEIDKEIKIKLSISSEKALRIAQEFNIDIFIIDIQLVDYKGTQLAKQIRGLDKYKYTPIIFATALAGEELLAYREIKCFSFLIKPFTKDEIKNAIKEVIDYSSSISPEPQILRVEQKSQIFEYDIKDIIYIESFRKKQVIHVLTVGNEVIENTISGYSLQGLLELIGNDGFIQCHKSYIINKRYIQIIMKDKKVIKLRYVNPFIPVGDKFKENLYN